MPGPLAGIRIVELAGIGPGPFCGMMLADHGAEVIRVDRPGATLNPRDPLLRSRTAMQLDLKSPDDIASLRALVKTADGLIEGFRPGVIERLGIGPDVLLADNPKLVIGRMTGWGQAGSYAAAAGHDINYIALSGVLAAIGRAGDKPTPPINLVGDYGGGGMVMAFGMVAAILSAHRTGKGQVVDCAMVDGASLLMTVMWGLRAKGAWTDARGTNFLDGGAPYYDSYETADGRFISFGPLEPPFYAQFLSLAGVADDPVLADQFGPAGPRAARLAELFRTRTREEWCALLEGTDACFAPVLSFDEAPSHPHNRARNAFIELDGVVQPAPAPRFSLTPAPPPRAPVRAKPSGESE